MGQQGGVVSPPCVCDPQNPKLWSQTIQPYCLQEVMEMTSEQANLYDPFGRIASYLEWTVTYAGFKDENGVSRLLDVCCTA